MRCMCNGSSNCVIPHWDKISVARPVFRSPLFLVDDTPSAGLVLSVFQMRVAATMAVEKEKCGKMKTR